MSTTTPPAGGTPAPALPPAPQASGETPGQQPPLTYDSWLSQQPADVQQLISGHTSGLKSALQSEREARARFEKEFKDAAKQLEAGSAARTQLEALSTQLGSLNAQASFYDAAHAAGVSNLRLAFLAAQDAGLLDDKGQCDFAKLQQRHPEMFARKQPAPPPANAGQGTTTTPAGPSSMNAAIRRMAGRG